MKPVLKQDTIIVPYGEYFYLYSFVAKKGARVKDCGYSEERMRRLGFFNDIPAIQEKHKIGPLFLLLTRDCPLGCVYCYANAGLKRESMPINIAERAVRAYLNLNPRIPNVRFGGGGEPSLEEKLIMYIIEKYNDQSIKWSMITSGVIKEDFLRWLIAHRVNITFSLDGPPEIQGVQRPLKSGRSSSEIVEKNCLIYRNEVGKLHIRCTLTKISIKNLDKLLKYFEDLRVTSVNVEPMYPMGRGIKNPTLIPSPEDTTSALLEIFEWGRQSKVVIRNISLYHPSLLTNSTFCGPINGTALVVNHQGYLVACGEALDTSHPFWSMWKIGELKEDHFEIDLKKQQWLMENSSIDSMESCRECFAKYICRGGCPMRRLFQTGRLNLPDPYHCFITKILVKALVVRMVEGKYPTFKELSLV